MKSTRPSIVKHIDLSRQLPCNVEEIEFAYENCGSRLVNIIRLLSFAHWGYSIPKTKPTVLLGQIENRTEELLKYRDKTDLGFLGDLSSAAFAGSLLEDDRVLKRIGEWIDVKPCEKENVWFLAYQPVLYRVCNLFRSEKLKSFVAIDGATSRKKIKVPSYHIEAVEAIESADSDKVFALVVKALEAHVKKVSIKLPKELLHGYEIPAVFPSLIWNAAVLKGLTLPNNVENRLMPFLITRRTLGL